MKRGKSRIGMPLCPALFLLPMLAAANTTTPLVQSFDVDDSARVVVAQNDRSDAQNVPTAPLLRPAQGPLTIVRSRMDGTLMLNGKPFFPLGIYESSQPSRPVCVDRLRTIADAGFNCVMNYAINAGSLEQIRTYLDTAHGRGLKVIYSLKDVYPGLPNQVKKVGSWTEEETIFKGVVTLFRMHPALLAWYVNDEMPLSRHEDLLRHYRWARRMDPFHPAWSVLYQVQDLNGYDDTTDVMGVNPYPVPGHPLSMVSNWTDQAVATGLPVWAVPQIHDQQVYNKRLASTPPTYEEMRCMTWLALAHGANGLVYYSYPDLLRGPDPDRRWEDVKRLAAEVKQAVPWLVSGGRGQVRLENGLHLQTWQQGTQTLVVIINPQRQAVETDVTLPAGTRSVAPLFESERAGLQGSQLHLHLAALEVHAYVLNP